LRTTEVRLGLLRTERRWRLSSPWGKLGGGDDDTVLKETRMEVSYRLVKLHAGGMICGRRGRNSVDGDNATCARRRARR
jgi:hypothetical protein